MVTAVDIVRQFSDGGFHRGLPMPPRHIRRAKDEPLADKIMWAVFGAGLLTVDEGTEREKLRSLYARAFFKALAELGDVNPWAL